MRIKIRLLLVLIGFLYLALGIIGTNQYSMFNGDNAVHIVQANYIKDNPEEIFGWSSIGFAGYPLLFFYQPLPHLLLALLFNIDKLFVVYRIIILLLFTLLPFSLFFSSKRMGFTKIESLIISFLPLLAISFIGFGFELFSFFAWGLFTQLFTAVLFPIALSQLWISIKEGKNKAVAILLICLVLLSHAILGLLILICALLVVLSDISKLKKRILNLTYILLFSFIILSFWLAPLFQYKNIYGGILENFESNIASIGLSKVFFNFLAGNILDFTRPFPFLTIIALASTMYLIYILFAGFSFHKKKLIKILSNADFEKERFIFYGVIISLVLFFGSSTLAKLPLISFFGIDKAILMMDFRFLFAVHFFLILAMALFLGSAIKKIKTPATIILIIIFILCSVSSFLAIYNLQKGINDDNPIDEVRQIGLFLRDYPEGRAYVNFPSYLPSQPLFYYYSKKPILDGFSAGGHESLSTKFIRKINLANETHLERYNVKYIVVPNSIILPYQKKEFTSFNLYFINTSGYFSVDEKCGNITEETKKEEEYSAQLSLNQECIVLFKMTYFPLWKAYSGNKQLNISLIEGSLMGISADKNTKEITMRYEDVWYRKYLFVLGMIVLIGLFVFENKKLKK